MCYHHRVVSRLARKHTQTNTVTDLPGSGRPHVTSQCEDRALHHLVRRMSFANSPVLKRQWLPDKRLSSRAVGNRLKWARLKSKDVIKRTMLSDLHHRLRLAWCLARRFFLIWGPCVWSIDRTRAGFMQPMDEWEIGDRKIRLLSQGTSCKPRPHRSRAVTSLPSKWSRDFSFRASHEPEF